MKSLVKTLISGFITSASFISSIYADTLYLKNGRTMEGIIKAEIQDSVDLEVFGGMVRFRKSEINRIEKSGEESAQAMRSKWEKKRLDTISKAKEEQLRKEFEPKQVQISQLGGHIVVEARINKKIDVTLILDTGASYVVLSNNIAKKLEINLEGKETQDMELMLADGRKVTAKRIILKSIATQGVEAENVSAAVLPEETADTNMKDGLLGMSFLKNFNFKVDQRNNKLILEKL